MKGMNIWNSFQQVKNGYLSDKSVEAECIFSCFQKIQSLLI